MPPLPGTRWLQHGAIASCVTIVLVAFVAAASWYANPVAGVLLDAGGTVSNFGLPGWDGQRQGLKFPDVVLEVDGEPLLARDNRPPASVWDRAVAEAWHQGRSAVRASVRTTVEIREATLRIHTLEPIAWWTYAGGLIFAGVLYLAAGLTALSVSPRSPLARTFAKVEIATGLMCVLSFDLHTTRLLPVVFLVAFGMLPLSWVALALRLPDDAPVLRRYPWLERAFDGIGIAVAITFAIRYATARETTSLQQAWTFVWAVSFGLFVAIYLLRFLLSEGLRRARLRALLLPVLPPHVLAIGIIVFPTMRLNRFGLVAEVTSYAMLSLFPLATAYAFIRYDLWGSRSILSRILTRLALGALVCAVAVGIGTFTATHLGAPFRQALIAATVAGVFAAVAVVAALRAADALLFAAREKYKPTVEQLGEELIAITSPADVARAIERTIKRWLPCDYVELRIDPDAQSALDDRSGLRRTSSWNLQLDPDAAFNSLDLPIDFGGSRLATLRVGEKRGQALYTRDDMDLLRTIVNQGALALAHAFAYQELETRRREQAAAWRGERAALVETVSAEIAHEIRYPINFFKSFFAEHRDTVAVDPEDLEIGREEVERLERLVSGLKRMAARTLQKQPVPLEGLCTRVEVLLRDALGERSLQRRNVDEVTLLCDPDQITQILVNLTSNGLQAAGEAGAVGIEWRDRTDGPELVLWDTGPGFEGDPERLFAPWYTTKEKGTGLGLAITHRLVRAHGWNIRAHRSGSHTEFAIKLRRSDVAVSGTDLENLEYPERSVAREDTHRRRSA
jgi:two-component system, NtrC family, sensor histidine kinase HydH